MKFYTIYGSEFKKERNLHIIKIRFDTFTFDKITKGVRANLMEKLSHFGGTAGLFNGFTIICVFEIIAFGITLIINYCMNKVKSSKDIEAEKIKKKENKQGKESADIKEQLEDIFKKFGNFKQELMMNRLDMNDESQKFKTMERELIVERHRMDEDAQKLKAMEKEFIAKIHKMENELKKNLDFHVVK